MARGELILRQWNLLKTLQTRGEGVPLRQLAEELGVSERTIQRDFEILEEVGFPIEHQEDEYGKRFWRMPADFFRTGPLSPLPSHSGGLPTSASNGSFEIASESPSRTERPSRWWRNSAARWPS